MLTKFGDLDDFFTFLEIKIAETRTELAFNLSESESINQDKRRDMTKEFEEIMDYILEDEPLKTPKKTKCSQTSMNNNVFESDLMQISCSNRFETPKQDQDITKANELRFSPEQTDVSMVIDNYTPIKVVPFDSLRNFQRTDTTLIFEQLDLSEDELDCIDALIEDYSKISNENEAAPVSKNDSDPLGLDFLSFPMSQFPTEFPFPLDDIEDEIVDASETLSAISEQGSSNSNSLLLDDGYDDKLFDFDLPSSQFPATQVEEPPNFALGFKTGKGNLLPPPSTAAMKRALSLIELDNTEGKGIIALKVTENVKRSRSFVEGEEDLSMNEKSQTDGMLEVPVFPSFSTAKGKILPPPSKEAMDRALGLIGGEIEENTELRSIVFSTGRGKLIPPPSKAALERARTLIDNVDYISTENNISDRGKVFPSSSKEDALDTPIHVGFSTGKGKALPPPSKEALEHARFIIDDPIEENVGFRIPPPSKAELDHAKSQENFSSNPNIRVSIGFSTGKGRALPPPSDEAMLKAFNLVSSSDNPNTANTKLVSKSLPPVVRAQSAIKHNNPLANARPLKVFSLSTAWKRPRKPVLSTTKPKSTNSTIKVEPVKLFDLNTSAIQRFKLMDFFKKTPNLSLSLVDYTTNYQIHPSILSISSQAAKHFKFPCRWGVEEAHCALLQNGAQSVSISLDWTRNHYRWIIWKFVSFIRTFPDAYSPENLSPEWVLSQLIYRYEREIHLCHRSALKKIIERDDAAGKYLCLMVSDVNLNEKCIELSDGWYSIWTSSLDSSLWDLVCSKRIQVGMKIEISGASITGQDAIPALDASSSDSTCRIVISRNSCRPTRWDTKLGFVCTLNRSVSFLKHLYQIHAQGGPIPAVSVIIDRVYPLLFREEKLLISEDGGSVASINFNFNNKKSISRNERDHFIYLETISPETVQSTKFTLIQRLRVIANSPGSTSNYVLVSFWNPLGEDQRSLLQEGTAVIITNLRARSTNTNQLSLISSKSTRLYGDTLNTSYSSVNNKIELYSYEMIKINDFNVNDTVDLVGIALGRVGNYFWFCGYDSKDDDTEEVVGDTEYDMYDIEDAEDAICTASIDEMEITHNNDTKTTIYSKYLNSVLVCLRNFNSILHVGDIINFRDLTFNLFDNKVNVAHFTCTEYSDFKRCGKSEEINFDESLKRFNDLTK